MMPFVTFRLGCDIHGIITVYCDVQTREGEIVTACDGGACALARVADDCHHAGLAG